MEKNSEIEIKKKEFHLSNERTFLAYVRTAASVLVLSAALFKFFTSPIIIVSAVISLVLGFLILLLGAYRFFTEKKRISREQF